MYKRQYFVSEKIKEIARKVILDSVEDPQAESRFLACLQEIKKMTDERDARLKANRLALQSLLHEKIGP